MYGEKYLIWKSRAAADRHLCCLYTEAAPDRPAVARLWRHLCGFSLVHRSMSGLYERLLEAVVRHLERPADSLPLIQCLIRWEPGQPAT